MRVEQALGLFLFYANDPGAVPELLPGEAIGDNHPLLLELLEPGEVPAYDGGAQAAHLTAFGPCWATAWCGPRRAWDTPGSPCAPPRLRPRYCSRPPVPPSR